METDKGGGGGWLDKTSIVNTKFTVSDYQHKMSILAMTAFAMFDKMKF